MNAAHFFEWFKRIVPYLKPNAVIVMDNAPLPLCEAGALSRNELEQTADKRVAYQQGNTNAR